MQWWQAAIVLVGAWAAGRFGFGYPRPPRSIRVLRPREYAAIVAAASATFPRGGAVPPSALDVDVAGQVDRFLAVQARRSRILMRLLFVLIEHATLLFPARGPGGWRRFSALTPQQQVGYLDGWRTSRLFFRRLVFTSLRAIVTMGYLGHPTVLASLGLTPREIAPRPCPADGLWPPISDGGAPGRALPS